MGREGVQWSPSNIRKITVGQALFSSLNPSLFHFLLQQVEINTLVGLQKDNIYNLKLFHSYINNVNQPTIFRI